MHSFPIGGGNPYLVYLPLGLGWLVAFCLIAGVSGSIALAREDRLDARSSRKAAFALEGGKVLQVRRQFLVGDGNPVFFCFVPENIHLCQRHFMQRTA